MSKICVIGLGGYSVFMNVDHFNKLGETVKADSLFIEAGGKGYNQAVSAARLGAEVSFLGAFGNDAEGKYCVNFLKKENITPLTAEKNIPTAYACIVTDSDGENRVTVYGGAAADLTKEDVRKYEHEIASSNVLVLQNEVPFEANLEAVNIAKKNRVTVIINPAPSVGFDLSLLDFADVITPNKHEATDLFGVEYEEDIIKRKTFNAVITLGGDGCSVVENGNRAKIQAPMLKAVDTTGAGDCFTGALAVAIAEGRSLNCAATFATKVAALAVTKHGAVGAMPYRNEVFE